MRALWESPDDGEPEPQPGRRTMTAATRVAAAATSDGVIRAT